MSPSPVKQLRVYIHNVSDAIALDKGTGSSGINTVMEKSVHYDKGLDMVNTCCLLALLMHVLIIYQLTYLLNLSQPCQIASRVCTEGEYAMAFS